MQEFYIGLAEILEIDVSEVTPDLDLTTLTGQQWDSLSVVNTLALIDEVYDKLLKGAELAKCVYVRDIEALIAADNK
jgi:acyl carrier protein